MCELSNAEVEPKMHERSRRVTKNVMGGECNTRGVFHLGGKTGGIFEILWCRRQGIIKAYNE